MSEEQGTAELSHSRVWGGRTGRRSIAVRETGTEHGLGSQDEVSVGGSVPVGVLQEAQPRPLHSNSFLSPLFLSQ